MSVRPLRATRILSLALNLPGPAALMRLRAMGARCIKLEPPAPAGHSGDPMQSYNSNAYATLHAGVKVIYANLKTDEGQSKLHRALAHTDILLTSFRPSALKKLVCAGAACTRPTLRWPWFASWALAGNAPKSRAMT